MCTGDREEGPEQIPEVRHVPKSAVFNLLAVIDLCELLARRQVGFKPASTVPLTPKRSCGLDSNIEWSTVSKAADRSNEEVRHTRYCPLRARCRFRPSLELFPGNGSSCMPTGTPRPGSAT